METRTITLELDACEKLKATTPSRWGSRA